MSKVLEKNNLKNSLNINLLDFLSHELKTPLSTLRLNIEFMKQTLKSKPVDFNNKNIKLDQIINIMDTEVEAMIQLISDMLDLRQMDEHTISLKKNWCQWNELIEPVQNRMVTLLKKNNLKIQTDNTKITIYADPTLFKQALLNLIVNAIEHSPKNSTIDISAHIDQNSSLIVSVRDHGSGIEESEQEKIFMPFYKRPKHTHSLHTSSGLGLSITKKIIESHGGTIKAANHPKGGAILTFTLPQPKNKK